MCFSLYTLIRIFYLTLRAAKGLPDAFLEFFHLFLENRAVKDSFVDKCRRYLTAHQRCHLVYNDLPHMTGRLVGLRQSMGTEDDVIHFEQRVIVLDRLLFKDVDSSTPYPASEAKQNALAIRLALSSRVGP